MIIKEYIKQINPKQKNTYNPKYSVGTYKFLNKYKSKDIKVYWKRTSIWDGKETEFNSDGNKFYPTHIFFIYKENGDYFGTSWTQAMRNKYDIRDCSHMMNDFDDITEWFLYHYFEIGRCLFDSEHNNFLLGENHAYVGDENRFEIIDGIKKCKWCGEIMNSEKENK